MFEFFLRCQKNRAILGFLEPLSDLYLQWVFATLCDLPIPIILLLEVGPLLVQGVLERVCQVCLKHHVLDLVWPKGQLVSEGCKSYLMDTIFRKGRS